MFASGEIWFQMTILLGIAVASHFVVTRFGQPMVIFEILLGIIIGPSLFAIITNSNNFITQFAQLGAVFLLFAIGLECNLKEIYTRKSLIIATVGVIVPWCAGYGFGLAIGQSFAASVFIGAILVATSVAVTAEILMELGQLDKSVGKAIIGAAVVDDILGMIVLTMAIGVSGGGGVDVSRLLAIVIAAGLFIALGAFIGARYLGRIVQRIERETVKVPHSGFLFALAVMFLYAFVAEAIGMSAIIGAFVAGTMFSTVAIKKEFDDGAKFLSAVFAPIFFVSIGIMIDLHGITTVGVVLWGILFTFIAIITKVIGCGFAARACGMSARESFMVGYGMSPRCEVALIIALLGLSAGIIMQDVYFIAVLMAILTTFFTPPLLKAMLEKKQKKKTKEQLIRSLYHPRKSQKKHILRQSDDVKMESIKGIGKPPTPK